MDNLEKQVSDYLLGSNADGSPVTIGQTIAHFSSAGYSKADIFSALSSFSKNHIAETTAECD